MCGITQNHFIYVPAICNYNTIISWPSQLVYFGSNGRIERRTFNIHHMYYIISTVLLCVVINIPAINEINMGAGYKIDHMHFLLIITLKNSYRFYLPSSVLVRAVCRRAQKRDPLNRLKNVFNCTE